jgi:hypothetical protein
VTDNDLINHPVRHVYKRHHYLWQAHSCLPYSPCTSRALQIPLTRAFKLVTRLVYTLIHNHNIITDLSLVLFVKARINELRRTYTNCFNFERSGTYAANYGRFCRYNNARMPEYLRVKQARQIGTILYYLIAGFDASPKTRARLQSRLLQD